MNKTTRELRCSSLQVVPDNFTRFMLATKCVTRRVAELREEDLSIQKQKTISRAIHLTRNNHLVFLLPHLSLIFTDSCEGSTSPPDPALLYTTWERVGRKYMGPASAKLWQSIQKRSSKRSFLFTLYTSYHAPGILAASPDTISSFAGVRDLPF